MKLKKFEQFIIENNNRIESTTSVITFDETEQFLINKLRENPNYFDNIVYRGINISGDYFKVDYKDFERRSAYSGKNYLNLILSNDKRFSEFQRRSKSIICSTNRNFRFGNSFFIVIPINSNSIFSYTDTEDLFDIQYPLDPGLSQEIMNEIFKYFNISVNDSNYNDYKSAVNEIDKKCESDKDFKNNFIKLCKEHIDSYYINEKNINFNNMSEFIDLILNIKEYNLTNINFLDIHTINSFNYEIWTESPCILLNVKSELVKKYNLIK
jgi:hypothetical protein